MTKIACHAGTRITFVQPAEPSSNQTKKWSNQQNLPAIRQKNVGSLQRIEVNRHMFFCFV